MTTADSDRDIRLTRVYPAPVARVWDAWTDLSQVAQWWGPRGFTITTHSKDLRPGGSWDYTMHGPDGTDYPNFTRYHEVEPLRRLVYDHGASSADAAPMFRVTATFRDLGDSTELEICMTLPTADAARNARVFIKQAGGNATWDRLAEFIEERSTSSTVFVIARSFDAPVEVVFDLWTTPAHLAAWLPPAGFSMEFQHADIRAGGVSQFSMTNGEFTMFARHEYTRVERPACLEYRQIFTDAEGNDARNPGDPLWPVTTLATVTFVAESPTQTRVSMRFGIVGAVPADEVAAFTAERAGMTHGWSGSFDALDALIAGHGKAM